MAWVKGTASRVMATLLALTVGATAPLVTTAACAESSDMAAAAACAAMCEKGQCPMHTSPEATVASKPGTHQCGPSSEGGTPAQSVTLRQVVSTMPPAVYQPGPSLHVSELVTTLPAFHNALQAVSTPPPRVA